MVLDGNMLDTLFVVKDCRTKRCSSYDVTGGNMDAIFIDPGETVEIADIKTCGIIRHIWMTMQSKDLYYARKIVLRMYWDDEDTPSIEAPIGDFFGIGHGIIKNYSSLPLSMNPDQGKGFNCYFPMPFSSRALITISNECTDRLLFFWYIDYEEYDFLDQNIGRFHAQWRRQNPTPGWGSHPEIHEQGIDVLKFLQENTWKRLNTTGKDNYIILEAEGKGHYVGCNLNIDCYERQTNDWYGEGDDMFFIDGEAWPPSIHGTGTEDYFCTAFCPENEFSSPFFGITVYEADTVNGLGWKWSGKNSLYRFHITDPIRFQKSIRFSIEHGHANNLQHDYSSTAYWYQIEPHKYYSTLLPVDQRLPRPGKSDK
jgi:hypothetical protein